MTVVLKGLYIAIQAGNYLTVRACAMRSAASFVLSTRSCVAHDTEVLRKARAWRSAFPRRFTPLLFPQCHTLPVVTFL